MLVMLGILVAIAAAMGLGFQIGVRRGLMLGAQFAEEEAVTTHILYAITRTSTADADD